MTKDTRDCDRFSDEPVSEVYWYPLLFDPEDEEAPTSIEPLPWFLRQGADEREREREREPGTAGSK